MKKLLYNAKIVNEGREFTGYVSINDGIITEVGEGLPDGSLLAAYADNTFDLEGHLLLPGVIDSHVHFREPGNEHKATIYSESRAAVTGGVTSFMEMPNTNPTTTTIEALEDKFARAGRDSMANYSFYIGATRDNIEVLKAVDYTRVPGVKLFMGSSTGGMLVDGDDALCEVFKLPVLIAAHCEDETTIRNNTNALKQLYPNEAPEIEWHPEVRSALACYKSTAHAIELAQRYNSRLHIMHLTTLQEVKLLADSPANITGEACVAHLIFDDADYARLGTKIKCNPAVKSRPHRNALREAVYNGIISTVSTDHAPHTLEEKNNTLFKAPSGMPMIQFSLPAMIHLFLEAGKNIAEVVQMMCHNQAEIFGVEKRGYIRPGYYADLVEVDTDTGTEVNSDIILSKCGWSPLEGTVLNAKVLRTWVTGNEVYTDTDGIIESNRSSMPLSFHHIK